MLGGMLGEIDLCLPHAWDCWACTDGWCLQRTFSKDPVFVTQPFWWRSCETICVTKAEQATESEEVSISQPFAKYRRPSACDTPPWNKFVWSKEVATSDSMKATKKQRDINMVEAYKINKQYHSPAWLLQQKKRFTFLFLFFSGHNFPCVVLIRALYNEDPYCTVPSAP